MTRSTIRISKEVDSVLISGLQKGRMKYKNGEAGANK